MGTFSQYKLIPQADGTYQLVLYLDFKYEIAKLPPEKIIEHSDLIQKQAFTYIREHLSGINIGSVQIMLGTLLVTSFLMAYPATTNESEFASSITTMPPLTNEESKYTVPKPIQPAPSTKPPSEPGEKPDTNIDKPVTSPVLPPEYGTKLVLVNKHYNLSPQYVPGNLAAPRVRFTFAEDLPQRYMQAEAAAALENLFNQAEQEGVILYAVSGYRSYQRQAEIFARNIAESPDANRYSARAGQSEHQTGLAMDITNATLGGLSQSFGATLEGQWVKANAARFGFIIRYPENKESITGYAYEPWHIRYVGVEAAQVIMNNGLTLEEYLGL